jgi:hypothetical protein
LINLVAYFYALFNAHVIYCNICFNYLVFIIYCFANIGTYVGNEPPQQDEEMEEENEKHTIHRAHMPRRKDRRVWIEMVDHLCGVMVSHGVVHTLV